MGNARTYYKEYVDTKQGLDSFHNEVINVPRPSFEGIGLEILQQVASYLLLIEGKTFDNVDFVSIYPSNKKALNFK